MSNGTDAQAVIELLQEIRDQQAQMAANQERVLELMSRQAEDTRKRVAESIDLQRVGIARQKQALWGALPLILLCLGLIGYLSMVSELMFMDLGATTANVLVGILSAIVDNIPVMFAVLTMNPEMSQGQWLLTTLTAGVGGSMLSIGSAAGVALMGQARGYYTFFGHLNLFRASYFELRILHDK